MIHIYEGAGKGKTTAAYGLAIRALGHNKTVKIAGFLKPKNSGEYMFLKDKADIEYFGGCYGFVGLMPKKDEDLCKEEIRNGFFKVIKTNCDILILDEIIDVLNFGFITEEEFLCEISASPAKEIVLTGRNPKEKICALADYYTCFEKIKHPYDMGIEARKGIEY